MHCPAWDDAFVSSSVLFDVICSLAMNMALPSAWCETWKFTLIRAEEVRQSHDKMPAAIGWML